MFRRVEHGRSEGRRAKKNSDKWLHSKAGLSSQGEQKRPEMAVLSVIDQ